MFKKYTFILRYTDDTPPSLKNCAGSQTVILSDDTSAVVAWDEPTAVDNSKEPLTVLVEPHGIKPNSHFTKTTDISYTFLDRANNSVKCQFTVFVKGILMLLMFLL